MSDNSSWWLLLPCGIVTVALTSAVVLVITVVRRPARPAPKNLAGPGSRSSQSYDRSPLGPNWTPDGGVPNPPDQSSRSSHSSHDAGYSSHGHHHSYGHTIDHGHHHGDPGSSWTSSSSSSSDSGSSWSDSGSSSSSDSGSGDSGSSSSGSSD